MSATPFVFFHLFWLLAVLILLAFGLWLLRIGLWPRRQGDMPHCRTCDYNLTGLTSDRCPECGTGLDAQAVVVGLRHRRPGLAVAGVVLCLPALACLSLLLVRVNWYGLKPTAWVIGDAQSSGMATARRAWRELDHRDGKGSLKPSHRGRLIEAGLREQGAATPGPCMAEFVEYLGKCYAAGVLSDTQKTTFFQQGLWHSLRVRPRVLPGRKIPYGVQTQMRLPYSRFWRRITGGDVSIDGAPTGGNAGFGSKGRGGTIGSSAQAAGCDVPGRHMLKIVAHVALYEGDALEESTSRLCYESEIAVEASFDVLDAGAPDCTRAVDDPALTDRLAACITLRDFRVYSRPGGSASPFSVSGMVDVAGVLPLGIAFEVFGRFDDREVRLGSLACPAGKSQHSFGVSATLEEPPGTTVDVILRASHEAAENSLNVFEYWQGELVFKDVPVQHREGEASAEPKQP